MIECYTTRRDAADATADGIARLLRQDLGIETRASLVLSGGSSPQECLRQLACEPLDWARVDVTLTDERLVPATDPASNEGMLRQHFLIEQAAGAQFVPLEATLLSGMQRPFSAVLCGMGTDGHIASLFPDLPDLPSLLALDNPTPCASVMTAASPHPRMTLTLSWLCQTRCVFLLVFGPQKRALLDDPQDTPVRHLLQQTQTPVRILWAP